MVHSPDDTIVAVASAAGGAARGIIRLSGPSVRAVLEAEITLARGDELANVARATAFPASIPLGAGLPCDVYYWPDGRSYTGQPAAEIHTIGSPPLLEATVRRLCAAGARLAEPGEFTLRAFLSGRLDLTQAEAVLGVIDAADPEELNVALAQLAGGLARPLHALREGLLDLVCEVEAGLDFADDDIPLIPRARLLQQLAACRLVIDGVRRQMESRAQRTPDLRVVLLGPPNAGKSSLFNALLGRGQALVSPLPGTTRDYLTAELDLGGLKCVLVDTAGFQDSHPAASPDAAAQRGTVAQRRQAALEIHCLDATAVDPGSPGVLEGQGSATSAACLVVLTKIDAGGQRPPWPGVLVTSIRSGEGLDELRQAIRQALAGRDAGAVACTALRCRESLRLADEGLRRAEELAGQQAGDELLADEVRLALDELGKVVGAVYTDDILDRVFSRFCIGK